MENNAYILTAVVALAVGAVAFFGGMNYQESKTPSFPFANGRTGGARQFVTGGDNGTAGGSGFTPVNGVIIKADNSSITVQMPDGSSKIVLLADTTQISESQQASTSALVSGETVAVFGQTNSDGSITAQNIQLNPRQIGH